MFEKILAWIKGVLARMLNTSSIKQATHVDVAISTAMVDALTLWVKLYENRADWLSKDIKSLNLGAAIASEVARSVTLEMTIEVTGSARGDYLNTRFQELLPDLRHAIEFGCAKGGVVFKPYLAGGKIEIDIIHADQFYPVKFNVRKEITAAIFVDQRQVGDKYYTRLEYHEMTPQGCVIRNSAYKSTSSDNLGSAVSLGEVPEWADIAPEAVITGIDKPLFAYWKVPLANNVDPTSPLGISCYARAVDLIEQADRQWSNLLWEFESGQRALFVDLLAFGKTTDGKPILPIKRLYRTLDTAGTEDAFFKEWTPDLREENILRGLDAILKKIEYTCGLAYGTLSDPQTVDKTATEIKTSKQRTYATVVDTQKALQDTLELLAWAVDVWASLANLAPRGAYAITCVFDDSVVVDKDVQIQQDRQTVGMGAMPKYIYLMRNYGMDEVAAKKWIAEAQAEQPEDLFQEPGA